MTNEDDFHAALDANPDDWNTRLVFADWLEDQDDPRAAGYRALAVQRRRPLQSTHKNREACWWHCASDGYRDTFHNIIPRDWFALLPVGHGSKAFWPLLVDSGGNKSRRECEDALARVFTQLPADRQADLLNPREPIGEPNSVEE